MRLKCFPIEIKHYLCNVFQWNINRSEFIINVKTKNMESNKKSNWLGEWSTGRIIRTVLGGVIIVGGFVYHEPVLSLLGAWFFLQGVLNMSCCCGGACGVPGNDKQLYKNDIKRYTPKQ